MQLGALTFRTLCLLAAVSHVTVEGHAAGRRLRVRSLDSEQSSASQLPYNVMAHQPMSPVIGVPPLGAVALRERPPRVHFLFLSVDRVNNIDVWKSFFAQAPADQFRAYVHCALPQCTVSVNGSPLKPVPTVPSFYCADLVTPMNQLLMQALQGEDAKGHPADKFVFVSDSTLPAKPFSHIYQTLVQRNGSDFCVASMKEWATRRDAPMSVSDVGKPLELAVKHHQWSILTREHAEKVTQVWQGGAPMVHDFLMRFQMNLPPRSRAVKTFGGSPDTGCLDEFYHMAAIYGTVPYKDSDQGTDVSLTSFTNPPLRVRVGMDIQGSCDTFVAWPEFAKGRQAAVNATDNAFKRFYADLDPTSVPYSGDATKPGYWDALSSHGMQVIRKSDFLFVRKFAESPKVADGGDFATVYPSVVFQ